MVRDAKARQAYGLIFAVLFLIFVYQRVSLYLFFFISNLLFMGFCAWKNSLERADGRRVQ
jgi:hypothetical protein